MNLSEIRAPKGAVKRVKRRGRGQASGHGKTSCRGHKGAWSRAGTVTHMAFEGGQMPLIRRMPKRGFRHLPNLEYQVVNLMRIAKIDDGAVIDAAFLARHGLIKNPGWPVKVLGTGEMSKPLTVKANAFSASAKKKIEQAGGKIEIVTSNK